MRLRLTVRRHGLPEVTVIWNVDTETSSPTVAQLLEQVNEVLQLESGEWGLEDYAVELKGHGGINYECLHFHPVQRVMKEEDEVIIRPLLTHDLKVRRLSGRQQISTDGKHLVDGIAFGRPLLRVPTGRPSILIPARKRARIAFDQTVDQQAIEDESSFEYRRLAQQEYDRIERSPTPQRLLLADIADDDEDDEEEDDDFIPGEDDDADDSSEDSDVEVVRDMEESQAENHTDEEQNLTSSYHLRNEVPVGAKNCLAGLTFLFAGKLISITRDEAKALVIRHGGAIDSVPTSTTSYAVVGFQPLARRLQKIKKNGLKVIDEPEFLELVRKLPAQHISNHGIDKSPGRKTSNSESMVGHKSLSKAIGTDLNSIKVQRLSEAFSAVPMTMISRILDGTKGDEDAAFEALCAAYTPSTSKTSVPYDGNLNSEGSSQLSKTNLNKEKDSRISSKANPIVDMAESSNEENLDDNPEDGGDDDNDDNSDSDGEEDCLVRYYDQNGLPPGSIMSGTALSHMAELSQQGSSRKRKFSEDAVTSTSEDGNLVNDSSNSQRSIIVANIDHARELKTSSKEVGVSDSSSDSDSSESNNPASGEKEGDEVMSSSSSGSSSDENSDSSSDDSEADLTLAMATESQSQATDDTSSESSSDDSSDSSSSNCSSDEDDPPEQISSKSQPSDQNIGSKTSDTKSTFKKPHQKPPNPPGQGKRSTQARNRRRRIKNVQERYQKAGVLPAGTTISDVEELKGDTNTPSGRDLTLSAYSHFTRKAPQKAAEFEARRQNLLASLASGGIEVGTSMKSPSSSSFTSKNANCQTSDATHEDSNGESMQFALNRQDKLGKVSKNQGRPHETEIESLATGKIAAFTQPPSNTSEKKHETSSIASNETPARLEDANSTPGRRSRLNLGAAGRLVFGALGVRAPKTKEDQNKVRDELMKSVNPKRISSAPIEMPPQAQDMRVDEEDKDAWKEKITYRAEECCYDGVKLSEPPFPFVQRWDPQQQGLSSRKGKRGRKRKKNQQDMVDYYDNSTPLSKKRILAKNDSGYSQQEELYENPDFYDDDDDDDSYHPEDSYDTHGGNSHSLNASNEVASDGTTNTQSELNEQLLRDSQATNIGKLEQENSDLPVLPEDVSTLGELSSNQITTGMVIAFKQLIMSDATKWQPQLSEYRTALITAQPNGNEIQLTLAQRDRVQNEKHYDDETGERIYGKFEMPDIDVEDGSDEDDGILYLSFEELIEPKLIKTQVSQETSPTALAQHGVSQDIEESKTSQDEVFEEANDSYVAETQFQPNGKFPGSLGMKNQKSPAPDTQNTKGDVVGKELHNESISEDTRQGYLSLVREAGFRSSIASGLVELDQNTTKNHEAESSMSSPYFKGLGLSPPRNLTAWMGPGESQESEWETLDSHAMLSSPAEPKRAEIAANLFDGLGVRPQIPVDPDNRALREDTPDQSNIASSPVAVQKSQLGESDEGHSNSGAVHYPSLPTMSSFTSQITDHGRQPDFNFDESALLKDDVIPKSKTALTNDHNDISAPLDESSKPLQPNTHASHDIMVGKRIEQSDGLRDSRESSRLENLSFEPDGPKNASSHDHGTKMAQGLSGYSTSSSDDSHPLPSMDELWATSFVKPENSKLINNQGAGFSQSQPPRTFGKTKESPRLSQQEQPTFSIPPGSQVVDLLSSDGDGDINEEYVAQPGNLGRDLDISTKRADEAPTDKFRNSFQSG